MASRRRTFVCAMMGASGRTPVAAGVIAVPVGVEDEFQLAIMPPSSVFSAARILSAAARTVIDY